MKTNIYPILGLASILLAACVDNDNKPEIFTAESPVKINEAFSRGIDSDYPLDWIELYNTSSEAVDISGFVLSDKMDMSEKITLPAGTKLAAHGFLKIEVDTPEGFGLSSDGDMVYLYNAEGEQVDVVEFGPMELTESWSAVPDGSTTFRMQTPTPDASNNAAKINPTVSDLAHTPTSPTREESVTVTATVAAGEGTISSVMLDWSINGTKQTAIAMTVSSGSIYSATIPAQAAQTTVSYSVVAKNDAGGETSASGTYSVREIEAIDYTGLVINEVDGNGKFIELYNAGKSAVSLTGVQIIKNEETDAKDVWWTGGAISLAAGDYYTICEEGGDLAEQVDEATGNGGISPKKNVQFELKTPDGTVVVDTFIRSKTLDLDANCAPDYGKTTPKYAFARCPDGTGAFGLAESSVDAANPATAAGTIETTLDE